MPCFCAPQINGLSSLVPQSSLHIRAVPPQLSQLAGLLGLSNGQLTSPQRLDLAMNAKLPMMSSADWLRSNMSLTMPGIPMIVPNGGPPMMSLVARLGAVGQRFPMINPDALLAELKQTLASMALRLLPFTDAVRCIPNWQITNMVTAARMTLGLRAQGLCPMALSGVDMRMSQNLNLSAPQTTLRSAINTSLSMPTSIPKFALPLPKLNLAMGMAALAPLATASETLGLPNTHDPDFVGMAMSMLSRLAQLPTFGMNPQSLIADLMRLSDLSAIEQAFGADAMTPAGIGRVHAMLDYVGRLNLPQLPAAALSLAPKLDMLPSMNAVMDGARVAKSSAATFATALNFNPLMPAILPLLEAINAFKSVLNDALGAPPSGQCGRCKLSY